MSSDRADGIFNQLPCRSATRACLWLHLSSSASISSVIAWLVISVCTQSRPVRRSTSRSSHCAGSCEMVRSSSLSDTALEAHSSASGGALPSCHYVDVQNNAFNAEGKAALKAAADVHGIKVHFGWPPPTPR